MEHYYGRFQDPSVRDMPAPITFNTEMNQKCKVCGEPAAGFHFGAFTCEGCKSFFGRSYNNLNSITECKNNGECVINKKNRTACKACRLRKCLLVGMSKSGSRYGRRSNWFKIHCLLQEQQQHQQGQQQANQRRTGKTPPPHPLAPPFPPHLFPGLAQRRAPCSKEELLLLGFDDYKHSISPSIGSPESHNSDASIQVDDTKRIPIGHFSHKLTSPTQETPPSISSPRDMFIPLHFANLAGLPTFPSSGAFLPPPGAFNALGAAHQHLLFPGGFHPALYPHPSLLKAPLNNNTRYNNNNNEEVNVESFTKRFYLDEVLKSQRSSPSNGSVKSTNDHCEEESEPDDHVTIKPVTELSFAKGLTVKRKSSESPIQENPMDLSIKSGSYSNKSRSRSLDVADSDSNEDDDDDNIQINGLGHSSGSDAEDELDFTTRQEVKRLKIHRSTPLDLTTKV